MALFYIVTNPRTNERNIELKDLGAVDQFKEQFISNSRCRRAAAMYMYGYAVKKLCPTTESIEDAPFKQCVVYRNDHISRSGCANCYFMDVPTLCYHYGEPLSSIGTIETSDRLKPQSRQEQNSNASSEQGRIITSSYATKRKKTNRYGSSSAAVVTAWKARMLEDSDDEPELAPTSKRRRHMARNREDSEHAPETEIVDTKPQIRRISQQSRFTSNSFTSPNHSPCETFVDDICSLLHTVKSQLDGVENTVSELDHRHPWSLLRASFLGHLTFLKAQLDVMEKAVLGGTPSAIVPLRLVMESTQDAVTNSINAMQQATGSNYLLLAYSRLNLVRSEWAAIVESVNVIV